MTQNLSNPCFNPLHCGAVVASRPQSASTSACWCFNPLHCGAVVASGWRLVVVDEQRFMFQSPSLRGSGRFN